MRPVGVETLNERCPVRLPRPRVVHSAGETIEAGRVRHHRVVGSEVPVHAGGKDDLHAGHFPAEDVGDPLERVAEVGVALRGAGDAPLHPVAVEFVQGSDVGLALPLPERPDILGCRGPPGVHSSRRDVREGAPAGESLPVRIGLVRQAHRAGPVRPRVRHGRVDAPHVGGVRPGLPHLDRAATPGGESSARVGVALLVHRGARQPRARRRIRVGVRIRVGGALRGDLHRDGCQGFVAGQCRHAQRVHGVVAEGEEGAFAAGGWVDG